LLKEYSAHDIESKWQKIWEDNKVFQAEPDSRKKFFLTIPYPYLNGNLHAGHTRTFTIGDAVARFRRMRGRTSSSPWPFTPLARPLSVYPS